MSSLAIGISVLVGLAYLWFIVRPIISAASELGELGTPRGLAIIGVVCLPLATVAAADVGAVLWGGDESRWPLGIKLGIGMFIAILLFVPTWYLQQAERHQQNRWIEESRKRSPKEIQEPAPRSFRETVAWMLGGMLPFTVVAWIVSDDPRIPAAIRVGSLLFLPLVGGGLGFFFSPAYRSRAEFLRRVEEEHGRHEQQQLGTQEAIWARRLKEAFFWWVGQGKRLYESEDVDFLRDYVRAQAALVIGRTDKILAVFHNEDDICSTSAKRQAIASWVVRARPDLIAEHLTNESSPSTERIGDILGLHFQRENHLLVEATALNTERLVESVRPPKEEPIEETIRRIFAQDEADITGAEASERFVRNKAADLPPSVQADFIARYMTLINDVLP